MNEDPNTQETAPEETSFGKASAGIEIGKESLFPYSPARERAAQAMGVKFPMWTAEEMKVIQGRGYYQGSLRDVTIFVWICSILTASEQEEANKAERAEAKAAGRKPVFKDVWTVQRADRNPDEAYEEACRFCEEKGIVWASAKFVDAYWKVVEKGLDMLNSRFSVEGGDTTADEPGNGH